MKRKYLTKGLGLGALATLAALTALSFALSRADKIGRTGNRRCRLAVRQRHPRRAAVQPADPDRHYERQGTQGRLAFSRQDARSRELSVIVGRTAYVTTTYGHIYALDAATGKKLWSYDVGKQKNLGLAAQAAVHGFPNRGVGVGDGRIYAVTPNALLLALDQEKGHLLWKKSIGNPVFLSESAAPIFYDGMVFVGSAGSESGARGFEAAYDAKTGRQIWRTTPCLSPVRRARG